MGAQDRTAELAAVIGRLVPVLLPGAVVGFDEVVVALADDRRARVSTAKLLRSGAGRTADSWPQLIGDWCELVAAELAVAVEPITADQLRLRLIPAGTADFAVTVAYDEYFELQLMADQPTRRLWVSATDLAGIGLAADDAVSVALCNTIVAELRSLDVRRYAVAGDFAVAMAAADRSPWVATGITSLPRIFGEPELPAGALAAVPRSSTLLFHRVADSSVFAGAVAMAALVGDLFSGAVDALSSELFWFYDGRLHSLAIDGTTVLLPPALKSVATALASR